MAQNAMDEGKELWSRFRRFSASGFGKGLIYTTIAVVAIMALVAGAMGAGVIGSLAVNGVVLHTFEAGASAGISKAFEFLLSSTLGWATLAAGGLIGSYADTHKHTPHGYESPFQKIKDKLRSLIPHKAKHKAVEKEAASDKHEDKHERREEDKPEHHHRAPAREEDREPAATPYAAPSKNEAKNDARNDELSDPVRHDGLPLGIPQPAGDQIVNVNNVQIDNHQHHEHNYELTQLNALTNLDMHNDTNLALHNDQSVNAQAVSAAANASAPEPAPAATPELPAATKEESIYVPDSAVKESSFAAAELKRRADSELAPAGKSI